LTKILLSSHRTPFEQDRIPRCRDNRLYNLIFKHSIKLSTAICESSIFGTVASAKIWVLGTGSLWPFPHETQGPMMLQELRDISHWKAPGECWLALHGFDRGPSGMRMALLHSACILHLHYVGSSFHIPCPTFTSSIPPSPPLELLHGI
jgi:hypothetical protein